jgi:hypothetical protein
MKIGRGDSEGPLDNTQKYPFEYLKTCGTRERAIDKKVK